MLLDFDGPVCSLFAGYPATQVAEELRALIQDALGHLPHRIIEASGPHDVLAATAPFGERLWRQVEEALQAAEIKAVESATATSGATEFVEACEAADRPVAIVSNNCEASVRSYLEHAGLSNRVRHVEARDPIHVDRMKPSPYLVLRAASALSVQPAQSVLVGDQVSDVVAASAAGARSVGYANKPGKADDLARAGATAVIDDMRDLSSMLGLAI